MVTLTTTMAAESNGSTPLDTNLNQFCHLPFSQPNSLSVHRNVIVLFPFRSLQKHIQSGSYHQILLNGFLAVPHSHILRPSNLPDITVL